MKKNMIVCILFVMFVMLSCCASVPTWQEQYDLGLRYLNEQNYEEAVVAFTAAIEIEPKQASAYVGRGDAYMQLAESAGNDSQYYDDAAADYREAIKLDENQNDVYMKLGKVCSKIEDYDGAVDAYSALLEHDNGMTEAYISRGDAYMQLAENTENASQYYEKAAVDYRKSINLDESQVDVYMRLGEVFSKLEDYDGAIDAYSSVLEHDEGVTEAYVGRGNACYEKADALVRDGDLSNSETYHTVDELFEQAKQDYLTALELGQSHEDVYINLADIFYRQGDKERARKILSDGYDRTGSAEIKKTLDYLMINRSGEITISGELFSNEKEYARQNESYKNEYGYTILEDGNLMSNVSIIQYGIRFSPSASVEINGVNVFISEAAAVNGGVATPPLEGFHEFTGYFTYIENYSEVMESNQGGAPYIYYPNGPYIFWITSVS